MKKIIAQTKEKTEEMLTKLGYVVMDFEWYQWALWYIAVFFLSFGTTCFIASRKNKG